MTTPQPQATGEPQAEDVRAIERLIAIVRRPYDVAGFDERVVAETANVDVAYNSGVGESDLAYVNVELEVIREAVFSYRDRLTKREERLRAFVENLSKYEQRPDHEPSEASIILTSFKTHARNLLAELADSATAGEDGER